MIPEGSAGDDEFIPTRAVPERITAAALTFLLRAKKLTTISNHLVRLLDQFAFAKRLKEFEEVWQFQNESVLCRSIDYFLAYLTDLLTEILETKPEALKSSDKVTLEKLLEHKSMSELVGYLAERKVNSLSYQGISDIADYFYKRLKLQLFDTSEERDRLVLAVEIRNLLIHNDGIINKRFIKKAPGGPYVLGKQLTRKGEWVLLGFELIYLAIAIDEKAVQKFSLHTQETPSDWLLKPGHQDQ